MDPVQVALTKFPGHVRELSDSDLISHVQALAAKSEQLRRGYSPKPETIAQVQQRLNLCFHEATRRDQLDLYEKPYLTQSRRRLANTQKNEPLRKAHYHYVVPGYKKAQKLRAIMQYARAGSDINYSLRNEAVSEYHQQFITSLDASMIKMPHTVQASRGFRAPNLVPEPGTVFQEKGYMGLTGNRNQARNFAVNSAGFMIPAILIDLEIPQGTPYLSVWKSAYDRPDYVETEQELILKRGQRILFEKQKSTMKHGTVQVWQARIITPSEYKEYPEILPT